MPHTNGHKEEEQARLEATQHTRKSSSLGQGRGGPRPRAVLPPVERQQSTPALFGGQAARERREGVKPETKPPVINVAREAQITRDGGVAVPRDQSVNLLTTGNQLLAPGQQTNPYTGDGFTTTHNGNNSISFLTSRADRKNRVAPPVSNAGPTIISGDRAERTELDDSGVGIESRAGFEDNPQLGRALAAMDADLRSVPKGPARSTRRDSIRRFWGNLIAEQFGDNQASNAQATIRQSAAIRAPRFQDSEGNNFAQTATGARDLGVQGELAKTNRYSVGKVDNDNFGEDVYVHDQRTNDITFTNSRGAQTHSDGWSYIKWWEGKTGRIWSSLLPDEQEALLAEYNY